MMIQRRSAVASVLFLVLFAFCHQPTEESKPPHLFNCPRGAVQDQTCDDGRGFCDRPGNSKFHSNSMLKCMPGLPCGGFPPVADGFFQPADITCITLGATGVLHCRDGYSTNGTVEITCEVSRNWAYPSETCRPVDCAGTLPTVPNGTFVPERDGTFMDTAKLVCGAGYQLTGEPCFVVCQADGTWSNTSAFCERLDCGKPPCVPFGEFVPSTSTLYTDTASISCSPDYAPSNAAAMVTCLANGTWSPTSVTCDPACPGALPTDPNGVFVVEGRTAELVCDADHLVFGRPCLLVCQDDGTWTNTTAFCARIVYSIARDKPTWQSSTIYGGVSSRAVDGNTNPKLGGQSCTATAGEYRPWWVVDLGQIFGGITVKLYNRQDCCASRLSEVYVFVSTTDNLSNNELTGDYFCGYRQGPVAATTSISCSATVPARYVKIILDKTDILTLCEVEVFVE